eukprot:scaffold1019_cov338-Pavlova_lutheri.AAC.17
MEQQLLIASGQARACSRGEGTLVRTPIDAPSSEVSFDGDVHASRSRTFRHLWYVAGRRPSHAHTSRTGIRTMRVFAGPFVPFSTCGSNTAPPRMKRRIASTSSARMPLTTRHPPVWINTRLTEWILSFLGGVK